MAEWRYYNPNPDGKRVGDCVIRAICAVTGQDWDETYTAVALQGYILKDMPSANHVWRAYLKSRGFKRAIIPDTCPDCYTVNDFADERPEGAYVLGTGNHAVAVVSGEVWDSWDSRGEIPIMFYFKEEQQNGLLLPNRV